MAWADTISYLFLTIFYGPVDLANVSNTILLICILANTSSDLKLILGQCDRQVMVQRFKYIPLTLFHDLVHSLEFVV